MRRKRDTRRERGNKGRKKKRGKRKKGKKKEGEEGGFVNSELILHLWSHYITQTRNYEIYLY
jgi:hypothetical protein